uniref:Sulfotransferase domain-containing protein n=1 Tax=viral metagenome TaxID=1070528 RepID=A0A6C0IR68_9ZZZZ
MIYINHAKKAIFIHIPKTGGSYIGPTLVKYYGFVSYLDLINRKRPDHNEFIRNCNILKNIYNTNTIYNKKPVSTGISLYDNSFFNKEVGIYVYCSTSQYFNEKMCMDDEKWDSYTKFCFIRHPYDRAVSGFNHINTIFKLHPSISTFDTYMTLQNSQNVSNIEYGHIFMEQTKHIEDINSTCAVDIIGKFEDLENDLKAILKQLGFDIIHRPEKKNVSNKLGSNTLSITIGSIKEMNNYLFMNDFANFHYKKVDL